MIKKLLLAGSAIAFVGSQAIAADLPAKAPLYKAPPPIAVYSWSGCYIGGHGGGGWTRFEDTNRVNQNFAVNYGDYSPGQGFDQDDSGWVAGGHIGCNYQTGQFVFGIEGSYAGADIKGTHFDPTIGAGDDHFSEKVTSIASVTGRLGLAQNNWLFYVKGGWAEARSKFSVVDTVGPFLGSATATKWHSGWTVGGGIEYGLTANWVIGVEANYYQFDSKTYELGNGGLAYTWDAGPHEITTVLGRLSYKFGGPIIARY
jgi:outer membrane immunogenic protein